VLLEEIRENTIERELPKKFRDQKRKQREEQKMPEKRAQLDNISILNRPRNDKQDQQMKELCQYQV
jgi:hypothetical protein